MFCEQCGQELAAQSIFCPACGTKTLQDGRIIAEKPFAPSNKSPAETAVLVKDTAEALKIIALDPTGKLSTAYEAIAGRRALFVGIAFAVMTALSFVFVTNRINGSIQQAIANVPGSPLLSLLGGGFRIELSFSKLLLFGLIPFVSLTVWVAVTRLICRGKGSFDGDVFVAGTALLPVGAYLLLSSLLNLWNVELLLLSLVVAVCYLILLLYKGCADIAKMPDAGAALSVPFILILTVWLTKVLITSI